MSTKNDIKRDFNKYYVSAMKRYADFKGRTSRKAYWMFVLINMIIAWFLTIWENIGNFNYIYSIIVLVPSFAIAARRLHDVGKPNSFLYWLLVPIYGWILVLIELVKVGDPEENEYGPVPVDGDVPEPGGHPYAKQNGSSDFAKASSDEQKSESRRQNSVVSSRESEVRSQKPDLKKEKKHKVEKIDRTVKWGRDRGAKDFRSAADKKRKS